MHLWRKLLILTLILIALCFTVGCSDSDVSPITNPVDTTTVFLPTSDPDNSQGWELLKELSDEFEGESVDKEKWACFYPGWDGRFPSWYCEKNVVSEQGKLKITMKKEKLPEMKEGYEYTTGIIRSLTPFQYGYCEIKAKCMNSAGSSAFWLNNATNEWWTEIDVFEIGGNALGHEKKIHTNVHEFYTPENVVTPYDPDCSTHIDIHVEKTLKWRPVEAFHIYGIEWSADSIKWYVDGAVILTLAHDQWHQELYVNIDSETMGAWWGLPVDEDLPSTFEVEYVRTWQKK